MVQVRAETAVTGAFERLKVAEDAVVDVSASTV